MGQNRGLRAVAPLLKCSRLPAARATQKTTRGGQADGKGNVTMGVIDRASTHVRRFLCGLHGHDALLHFEQGRLSLVCATCGHETPGWDLTGATQHGKTTTARPRRIMRLPLVGERRVA